MKGGRTRPSQYVNANPRYKLQQTFSGGVESYVSVAGVFYKVHTFSDTGSSALTSKFSGAGLEAEYLIIAGGGAGGGGKTSGAGGGGGGAGGYRTNMVGATSGGGGPAESAMIINAGTYTVIVGAGGTAPAAATTGPQYRCGAICA